MGKSFKIRLVSVLVAAALLSGCGGKNTSQKDVQQQSSKETTTAADSKNSSITKEAAKPEQIWWIVHDGLKLEEGTDQWTAEFEKKTGIELRLDIVANNEYNQILDLAFASGEVPDIFDLSMENLAVYAGQDAVADLTELVENSLLYDKVDPVVWDSVRLNGRIYGIPKELQSPSCTYVRKDWLDRLGMEVPTTYPEFITMLERFKNEIPECTVPMTAIKQEFGRYMPEFFQGATTELIYKDGQWIDGMVQPEMAVALTNTREAYEKGLLDQEFITNTTSNCRDQWYSGSVGVFNYLSGMWGKQLTDRLQLNVPEAEVVAIPPIEGATYHCQSGKMYCINAKLSEEEIASRFQYFLLYMNDGGEGQLLFQSGVEGLHWEQNGEFIKPLPSLANSNDVINKVWINPWLSISDLEMADKKNEPNEMLDTSLEIGKTYAQQKYAYPLSKTLQRVNSDLETLKQEIVAKIIMGNMTVEEGLEKYNKEAEMLDVNRILVEMNQKK